MDDTPENLRSRYRWAVSAALFSGGLFSMLIVLGFFGIATPQLVAFLGPCMLGSIIGGLVAVLCHFMALSNANPDNLLDRKNTPRLALLLNVGPWSLLILMAWQQ